MLRFTETTKWSDPWFQNLSPEAKLFYLFLVDYVDYSGVWEENWSFAEFLIGQELSREEIIEELGDRVIRISEGKILLHKFIAFQLRGAELNPSYNPHKAYLKCLDKHGLEYDPEEGITKACPRLAQAFQEKKKIKEKIKEEEGEERILAFPEQAIIIGDSLTASVIVSRYNEICKSLPKVQKISPKRQSAINARIKEGLKTLEDWEEIFTRVEGSDFLTGRDRTTSRNWRANLDWIINPNNLTKIEEGNYESQKKKGQDYGGGF